MQIEEYDGDASAPTTAAQLEAIESERWTWVSLISVGREPYFGQEWIFTVFDANGQPHTLQVLVPKRWDLPRARIVVFPAVGPVRDPGRDEGDERTPPNLGECHEFLVAWLQGLGQFGDGGDAVVVRAWRGTGPPAPEQAAPAQAELEERGSAYQADQTPPEGASRLLVLDTPQGLLYRWVRVFRAKGQAKGQGTVVCWFCFARGTWAVAEGAALGAMGDPPPEELVRSASPEGIQVGRTALVRVQNPVYENGQHGAQSGTMISSDPCPLI